MSIFSGVSLHENNVNKWDKELLPNTPGCIQKLFAGVFWFGATDIRQPSVHYMTMVGSMTLKTAHQTILQPFLFSTEEYPHMSWHAGCQVDSRDIIGEGRAHKHGHVYCGTVYDDCPSLQFRKVTDQCVRPKAKDPHVCLLRAEE